MKSYWLPILVSLASISIPLIGRADFPTAKVNVIVQDSAGAAVPDSIVGIGGTMRAAAGEEAKGLTSSSGIFTAEVKTTGEIAITARKTGYYDTFGPTYNFRNVTNAES